MNEKRRVKGGVILARVVLGLSGGVDSAAAAILLQKMGHEVHALYMANGEGGPERAAACAEMLGLPFSVDDRTVAFKEKVITPFFESYLRGETPNPCIICNPAVKFRTLFDYADAHGCDYVATGHYARVIDGRLYQGRGRHDQSYMLYRLPQEWIERCMFPLGEFEEKEQVRQVAMGHVPDKTSQAAASMEICFIPEGRHPEFMESHGICPPPGDFVDDEGRVLGRHQGIHRYTVGMRKRLGIALGQRMYVRKIDPENNRVVLSPAAEPQDQLLYLQGVCFYETPRIGGLYGCRVRHSRRMGQAEVLGYDGSQMLLRVTPEAGIPAPGQSAVLYDGEKVMGGGFISAIGNENSQESLEFSRTL